MYDSCIRAGVRIRFWDTPKGADADSWPSGSYILVNDHVCAEVLTVPNAVE
ncbi:hypothetical protein PF001_g29384 [Phytophthora fragariae]|uniref:Uncharacterized protein n=1 Tax=Phytophthora fragariae TaxID=53985 RepID=A0A6A3D7F1_9STRA|nr:hypothetical protein PF003_g1809 [Phytophthora fragariae]KAE8917339.1 hypothetical protein PF009_g32339 [Phytophthora fragariae]KAE9269073.1 hypothetical protein PF001_g29384 [Phytophthora fragariae]